jgi:hypothetical protein
MKGSISGKGNTMLDVIAEHEKGILELIYRQTSHSHGEPKYSVNLEDMRREDAPPLVET